MNDLSDDFPRSFAFGCILALLCFLPLYAQTAPTAPPLTAEAATIPAPAGQAPDSVTSKIADLVHAGKYAEAQQLTTGLLAAYPNDPRLIKTKALLDKLLATAAPAPASNQPAGNVATAPPAASATPEPLTGMDKVDYNALIELARQAQATTDLGQQDTLLHQYMDQSSMFLQKHPDQILLWQLRAASAISLNEPLAGYDAGQKLLALDAADSNDPNLQRLLAQLKNMGWLDKQQAEAAQERAEAERLKAIRDKYTFPVRLDHKHGGLGFYTYSPSFGHLVIDENDLEYDGSDGNVRFSSGDVREIKAYAETGYFLFVLKNGKTYEFFDTSEEAVTEQKFIAFPPGTPVLGNAVLERWKFVPDAKTHTLRPPPAPGADR